MLTEPSQHNPFRPWLVQRLMPSNGGPAEGPFTPMGFKREASELLGKLYQFDYMGAAEFEFGAIPKCLQAIAKDGRRKFRYGTRTIQVLKPSLWHDQAEKLGEAWNNAPKSLDVPIHFIATKTLFDDVVQWVQGKDAVQQCPRLKENTYFQKSAYMSQWRKNDGLHASERSYGEAIGWLEIRYGFFYFLNEGIAEKTRGLFGVTKERREYAGT